jgi:hypothetical protein
MEINKIKYVKLLLCICYSFIMLNCNSDAKKKDFYTYSRVSDLCRIPLIEPLEIISAAKGIKGSWTYQMRYNSLPHKYTIDNIDSVGVKSNIIVIFSGYTYINNRMAPCWFVINMEDQNEASFMTFRECDSALKGTPVRMYAVEDLFRVFDGQKKLPAGWRKNGG